jgi:SH3-like domain-containing protein
MGKVRSVSLIVLFVGWIGLTAFAAEQKLRSVQVKEGHVRSGPSFLSPIIARLAYGDQVRMLSEKGGWAKVSVAGRAAEGWMHSSALSEKRIIIKSGAQDVGQTASRDEVALAGKGFNADVEKEFKAKHREVNYRFIDQMEKIVVSQTQMQEFVRVGGLSPDGGDK